MQVGFYSREICLKKTRFNFFLWKIRYLSMSKIICMPCINFFFGKICQLKDMDRCSHKITVKTTTKQQLCLDIAKIIARSKIGVCIPRDKNSRIIYDPRCGTHDIPQTQEEGLFFCQRTQVFCSNFLSSHILLTVGKKHSSHCLCPVKGHT